MRGGTQKLRYSLSGGYLDNKGIVINSGYQRLSTRLNLDFEVNDKLRISTNTAYTRGITDKISGDNNERAVLTNALRKFPWTPVYDTTGNGNYNYNQLIAGTSNNNPIAQANEVDWTTKSNRLIQALTVNYEPIKGLNQKPSSALIY